MIVSLLRQKWYPLFLPKPGVKKYKIYSWKAVGLQPFEGITFNRIFDRKAKFLSIIAAEKYLLSEDAYIKYAKSNNFNLNTKSECYLEFSLNHESSSP